jgi:hypothetical protein
VSVTKTTDEFIHVLHAHNASTDLGHHVLWADEEEVHYSALECNHPPPPQAERQQIQYRLLGVEEL